MIVRTRFAPSPTGYLHVGGARTALFSYLFAKKHNGVFILRIEDTDLERSTEEAVQAIHEGMAWLGLNADEGPFYQTKRFDRYHAVIKAWLDQGLAYRCTCSKERLEALRETQLTQKEKPRYDGHCRHLSLGPEITQPFVVRFKNPIEGEVIVHDAVHGDVVFQNKELDDLIIARSDGSPTYNFTVVVDDADMNITHVIRGDDHLNNTPRQINMLRAMNVTIPIYAHLPMILGADGKKLSKRHGAVSVMQFRDEGFLPEALLNYLVRLGWSHGDQEIFSMPEMIDYFSLDHLSKSAAIFDQNKLLWLNQHYIKTSPIDEIVKMLEWQLNHLGLSAQQGPSSEALILAFRERAKTLKEMAEQSAVFFGNPPCSAAPPLLEENVKLAIKDLHAHLNTTPWELDPLHNLVKKIVEKHQLKFAQLGKPLREILINNASNLPVHTLLFLLGQKNSLQRLAGTL